MLPPTRKSAAVAKTLANKPKAVIVAKALAPEPMPTTASVDVAALQLWMKDRATKEDLSPCGPGPQNYIGKHR
jgi:hypothetical protein